MGLSVRRRLTSLLAGMALTGVLATAQTVQATEWRAKVGAQSSDKGHQALTFLPNEIWIHSGDSITWTFAVDEIHTLTFLTPGQVRPGLNGCPGFSTSPASFDGSTCVSTPPLTTGAAFNVNFPATGNFKFVCLVHNNMTGVVHVLDASQTLPHNQDFYDDEARDEGNGLLSDSDHSLAFDSDSDENHVTAGIGEISATAGGSQTRSVLRFIHDVKVIHAGETAEWTNQDPITPHTITFGTPPANPTPPSNNVTTDADGALHATIKSTSDNVHSGFIAAALQDQTGLPQTPPGVTRFRVTFTTPGTYPYMCVLHGGLGMMGKVVVLP